MTLRVDAGVAADEAALVGDASLEVRERAIDARVHDCDFHRGERRRRVGPRVERVVVLEVPLLRRERIGRRERDSLRHERERGDRYNEQREATAHQCTTIWGGVVPAV